MDDILAIDNFAPHLHASCDVAGSNGSASLKLVEVKAMSGGARPGGAFALLWEGASSEALQQGTYRLTLPELGELDVFLVPIAQFDDVMQYEAVYA